MKFNSMKGEGDSTIGDCNCCCSFPSCRECRESLYRLAPQEHYVTDRWQRRWHGGQRTAATSIYKGEFKLNN